MQRQADGRHRERQALLRRPPVRRADIGDVELAEQGGQRQLHLQQRQVAAGADARAGAKRHRDAPGRVGGLAERAGAAGAGPLAGIAGIAGLTGIAVHQPALGLKRAGPQHMLLTHRVAPQQADHHHAGRHLHIAQHGVAHRLQRQLRRHRLEPHRLQCAGLDKIELVHLGQRGCQRGRVQASATDPSHLAGGARQRGRVLPQQVDHPGDGVGGGVLTGQQHRQHIAGHLGVVDAAARRVGGGDHRFQQVVGPLAQAGVGLHAGACLADEAVHRRLHLGDAVLKLPISRRAPQPPGGQRRQDAFEQRREQFVQMLLDHVVPGFQRVDVGAKSQAGDGVHGVAHQVGLQVDGRALPGRPLPAPAQPLRHLHHRRKVALDMRRVEARHHHAALRPPGVAVGAEQPDRQAHLQPDLQQPGGAAKAIGPVAQHRRHHGVVAHHQHLTSAQLEAEVRAEVAAPLLELQMQAWRVDLQQIAQQRQAARARQVGVAAQRPGGQRAWRRRGGGRV